MPKLTNLTGRRFGRLTVVSFEGRGSWDSMWKCRCDCGEVKTFRGGKIKSGHTKSCGCLQKESVMSRNTTHGKSKSPTYKSWHYMITRCENPKTIGYKNYGGRGIKVCERWHKFENFLADMGERPPGLEVERKDNDGNYEPRNCRWATRKEQTNNSRHNHRITFNGKTMSISQWADFVGLPYGRVQSRIYHGWPIERALQKQTQ